LPPATGHARDVRPPEHPARPESVEHLAKGLVNAAKRIIVERIARLPRGLDRDVRVSIRCFTLAGAGSSWRPPNLVECDFPSAAIRDRPTASLWEICGKPSLTESQNSTLCIYVVGDRKMWYLGRSFSGSGDRNGRRIE
jgi:hypothetical protein